MNGDGKAHEQFQEDIAEERQESRRKEGGRMKIGRPVNQFQEDIAKERQEGRRKESDRGLTSGG